MSVTEFATVIGTLALATGRELDDETAAVYFDGLKDIPVRTFQSGVGRLIRSSRFFPSVGEIRTACDFVSAGRSFQTFTVPALTAGARDDDPRFWYACTVCQDGGWASYWCPGAPQQACPNPALFVDTRSCGATSCSRMGAKGYGHEFVMRCVCYSTNPKIRERLDSRRKYAEAE